MKYFVLLVCLSFYVTKAVDIGSDSAVNRFNTQQDLGDGDRIAGFAALDAGFALNGLLVTATFDSFFPVSGEIMTNFGTLSLNQDLMLQNITSILIWGNINGNGHRISFSPSVTRVPLEEVTDGSSCSITFTFEEIKADTINTVHFSFDNQFLVSGINAALQVDEVINENFLELKATTALSRTINNARWHPSKDYIGLCLPSGTGDEVFTYTFSRAADTLTLIDSVEVGGGGNNGVNEVAWHPDGDHLAFASDSNTLAITVYVINANGTFGASTSITNNTNVNTVDWDVDGGFLAVGTSQAGGADELRVYSFTKSPLTLTLNASFNTAATINSISWNKSASANGEIVLGSQTGDTLRIFRHNGGAGTLTEITTGLTLATAVNSVDWYPNDTCIAAGLVNNNEGTSGEIRTYIFKNDTLTESSSIESGDDTQSVSLSPNGRLLATGDDGLGGSDPALDLFETMGFGTDTITFDDVHLFFNNNVTIQEPPIKFTGESSVDGGGHALSFASTFSLEIQSNASLLFRDVRLEGIRNGTILLVDTTSTVSFQNVTLVLDGDYTFDTGHFEVLQNLMISGDGHSFIYQSTEPSTILGKALPTVTEGDPGFCGTLMLDTGVTFKYDSSISDTLLVLEDITSKIVMLSATLEAASALELIKGTLQVDGGSSFVATSGITYGDGTAANNLNFEILPAATIEVTGQLTNKNV